MLIWNKKDNVKCDDFLDQSQSFCFSQIKLGTKTNDVIIGLAFSVRSVRSLLHEVKTGKKSWSMEKQAGFKLHVTLVCYAINFCKFVPFSILLRRWTVHVELSFMIYSALPMPPFFCCTFWGNFWKARKNTLVFENDSQRLFKIIIISVSLIYAVGCDTRKYKPSQKKKQLW